MIARRAHVCIVAPEFIGPFPSGSAGSACYWEAASLAAAGFDVTVLYTGPTDRETPAHWERACTAFEYVDLAAWAREAGEARGIDRVEHPCPEARMSELVYRFLRSRRFDLLLFQELRGHGARTLQARRSGDALADVPAAVTLHSCRQGIYQGMQRASASRADVYVDCLERESARLADYVNAPSRHIADLARQHWHLREPAMVVPYCFDPSVESETDEVTHAGPFDHIVFFGRLDRREGLHPLCRAIAEDAAARGPVRRITLLGSRSTAAGAPIEDAVRGILANVDGLEIEIIDTLESFEALEWIGRQHTALVVAPGMGDHLPYAIIALFARRIPFITTRIGGIPEIVGPGNAHLLAEATTAGVAAVLARVHEEGRLTVDYRGGYSSSGATADHVDYVHSLLRWRRVEPRPTPDTCDIVVTDTGGDVDSFRHRILTSDPTARAARFVTWDEWQAMPRTAPAIFTSASVALKPGAVRRLLNALQDARVDAATSYYAEQTGADSREIAPLVASLDAGWASNACGGPCVAAAPTAFNTIRLAAAGGFDFPSVYAAMTRAGLDVALVPASVYASNAGANAPTRKTGSAGPHADDPAGTSARAFEQGVHARAGQLAPAVGQ